MATTSAMCAPALTSSISRTNASRSLGGSARFVVVATATPTNVAKTSVNVGAIGALRSMKGAIEATKLVMEHIEHTFLIGSQASNFDVSLGLPGPTNLSTDVSLKFPGLAMKRRVPQVKVYKPRVMLTEADEWELSTTN